ncbi:hypothetical protein [Legionella oakridgensis]|uniref:Uncharacterized protein n=2 Tax=Legionella oakridgensis TaxID=29423 RepID=W0BB08_9GAMM|nr:hypothetical protein [Legionella oakridgensis]AHE67040.1 hypothetical protein Loa_01489 [Legionella oakridgensis ATCC 33761 = DSM 21215]ETO93325.1 hypothetical protein LOR_79c23030 [Legionella oakridgensis RV-2-2007]KTD37190.1 hypothetical protein Loak_2326 [Legionella oakridgensis]STY20134.1 Uncharacterised protein [Legionella longbeachae]
MPRKVFFSFAGTGDTADNISNFHERKPFGENVIRIYFNGCQDSKIGGGSPGIGYIAPDLDVVASKLRTCFTESGELSLETLKRQFGSSIIIKGAEADLDRVAIDDIHLQGFSRGAVTTFATARHLDDLNIPISLIAADPVPGNTKAYALKPSSEFYKNRDLRGCKNLRHAEVILGTYDKEVNPLHNTYFRQMAPLFSTDCQHFIYTVPKTHHLEFSRKAENHVFDYCTKMGLTTHALEYDETLDRMFYTPKILQQKFHVSVAGRTQLSLRYKQALFREVSKSRATLTMDEMVKAGQALYALNRSSDFPGKDTLCGKITENRSTEGKALREFIVEFENILQYFFHDNEKIAPVLDNIRQDIYQLINQYSCETANHHQKQALIDNILKSLESLKGNIPARQYTAFYVSMAHFMKENVMTHPELVHYLDETETYHETPCRTITSANPFADIKYATSAEELATILYHMSERSRAAAYDDLTPLLPRLVTNANQLGDILRFLPSDKIKDALNMPHITALINNIEDANLIMGKLFTNGQRNQVFQSILATFRDRLKDSPLSFEAVGNLMQFLSADKCRVFFTTVPFASIHATSNSDVLKFFEKLTTKQLNAILPLIAKQLTDYIKDKMEPTARTALEEHLTGKMTGESNLRLLSKIFPERHPPTPSQHELKAKITIARSEMLDCTLESSSIASHGA